MISIVIRLQYSPGKGEGFHLLKKKKKGEKSFSHSPQGVAILNPRMARKWVLLSKLKWTMKLRRGNKSDLWKRTCMRVYEAYFEGGGSWTKDSELMSCLNTRKDPKRPFFFFSEESCED